MADEMSNSPTRGQKAAERRIERWLRPSLMAGLSEGDGPAYRALVDALLGAMVAVGPADATQGIAALVKTLALMLASTLRLEDDAKAAEVCAGMGAWIDNEVVALRNSMFSTAKKEH